MMIARSPVASSAIAGDMGYMSTSDHILGIGPPPTVQSWPPFIDDELDLANFRMTDGQRSDAAPFQTDEIFSSIPEPVSAARVPDQPICDDILFDDLPMPDDEILTLSGVDIGVVPSRRAPPAIGGKVMMSLTEVPGGIRFFYRGLVGRERVYRIRDYCRDHGRPGVDIFLIDSVPGRSVLLLRCDVVLSGARGPYLLALVAGRQPGFLARLLSF